MLPFVPKEKRTPIAWRNACLDILRTEVHPDYNYNRDVKGIFTEITRKDAHGLYLSYTFTRIHDVYYPSFGVLFTLTKTPFLISPFVAGSRFDHSRVMYRLFHEDFGLQRGDPGYPSGVWSGNHWYDNTLDLLVTGLKIPEQHLYPRYLAMLRQGKTRLAAIYQRASEICAHFDPASMTDETTYYKWATSLGLNLDGLKLLKVAAQCDAVRLCGALKSTCYGSYDLVDLSQVPLDSVVFYHLKFFCAEKDHLLTHARTALAL